MKTRRWMWVATAAGALALAGCQTLPPGAEPGPDGTMAYTVLIEASEPGARIEANGELIGNTPVYLKIYGDPDGTFHDFGSDFYVIRALPLTTNQFAQTRLFGTGRWFGPEDRIPQQIYFDMNQAPPPVIYGVPSPPTYVYPYYYYSPPLSFHFHHGWPYYYGPHFFHRHHFHHNPGLRYYRAPAPVPAPRAAPAPAPRGSPGSGLRSAPAPGPRSGR